ncbi:hypothetical protein SCNU_12085 [Gordonia neofelifaecis NRRL B-59395]|uniref:Uncharacterized protein n=1 Tax=Gordonia neofelifaecis NRRL B-59395 TaxID=644548 RepID=F1YKA0_9ACTN|nr:hypothetical protein SCNU_12085 [Gordonia neofelifaecis NRRL B-59395]
MIVTTPSDAEIAAAQRRLTSLRVFVMAASVLGVVLAMVLSASLGSDAMRSPGFGVLLALGIVSASMLVHTVIPAAGREAQWQELQGQRVLQSPPWIFRGLRLGGTIGVLWGVYIGSLALVNGAAELPASPREWVPASLFSMFCLAGLINMAWQRGGPLRLTVSDDGIRAEVSKGIAWLDTSRSQETVVTITDVSAIRVTSAHGPPATLTHPLRRGRSREWPLLISPILYGTDMSVIIDGLARTV